MDKDAGRRAWLAGAGLGLAALPVAALAQQPVQRQAPPSRHMLSAAAYGAVGDGRADDTVALQAALDAAFAPGGPGFLAIPPGTYRVTRTLRIQTREGEPGNLTRNNGISGHGARLVSAIANGDNVLEFVSRATVRFLLIEGLDILGRGREGHGIHLECEHRHHFLYNLCLRDVSVQGCGGDGCRMIGNVFEGQLINCYFRDNKHNGLTLGHGMRAGILSAVHAFGCVFGQNGRNGVAMVNGCYDAGFHGCYFLLNAKHGLVAENGCTLLANCGFENNHESAADFESGDAGMWLQGFGTLIGCTAYSMFKQQRLLRAHVVGQLVMIGCSGSGDARARGAGLARIGGEKKARATIIGASGTVDYVGGFEGLEIGGSTGGIGFGAAWNSPNQARLGDYRMWVDRHGRLRIKKGVPSADEDGTPVGA